MKNFEYQLPENYEVIKVIDAKDKKTARTLTIATLIVTVIVVALGTMLYTAITKQIFLFGKIESWKWLIFCVLYILIVIIHELIHGLFYKIYTKEKLTFGLTLYVAYCGVPNLYVYKKPMIYTAMAPCVILSTLLLIPMFLVNNIYDFWLILLVFACHFGGCCGDIYSSYLLKFKYKNSTVLINDTGPTQTIYDVKQKTQIDA